MRPSDNIASENSEATRTDYKASQKEWSDTVKVDLNGSIDLSKISISYCHSLLKRINNGTSVLVGLSIVGGLFAIGEAIFSLGFSVHGFYLGKQKNEQSSSLVKEMVPLPAKEIIQEKTISNIGTDSKLSEEWNQKVQIKDIQIIELKEKIVELQAKVNKKPSYFTCVDYSKELEKLYQNKQNVEIQIQMRLAPEVSKEYAERGIYYSTDQLEMLAKQASEYRKMADDIQRQILAVQVLRDKCE